MSYGIPRGMVCNARTDASKCLSSSARPKDFISRHSSGQWGWSRSRIQTATCPGNLMPDRLAGGDLMYATFRDF
eukprot:4824340-Pyramimonas_sp.AAC.2